VAHADGEPFPERIREAVRQRLRNLASISPGVMAEWQPFSLAAPATQVPGCTVRGELTLWRTRT
jgi:hypothetical protein